MHAFVVFAKKYGHTAVVPPILRLWLTTKTQKLTNYFKYLTTTPATLAKNRMKKHKDLRT